MTHNLMDILALGLTEISEPAADFTQEHEHEGSIQKALRSFLGPLGPGTVLLGQGDCSSLGDIHAGVRCIGAYRHPRVSDSKGLGSTSTKVLLRVLLTLKLVVISSGNGGKMTPLIAGLIISAVVALLVWLAIWNPSKGNRDYNE